MKNKVLYLGDTLLTAAASYLASVMSYYDIDFDYVASDVKFDSKLLENDYSLIILSDYPASNFNADQLDELAGKISIGTGLLMIGGWDSFTGLNGGYNKTVLKDILPVEMLDDDDRINYCQTCLIKKEMHHPIIAELPLEDMTPAIGGYNILNAKADADVILSTQRFENSYDGKNFNFKPVEKTHPLLVTGKFMEARVAAFATDLAPHWVGPFVDYGISRINAQAEGASEVEVGNYYAKFISNLVKWTAGIEI